MRVHTHRAKFHLCGLGIHPHGSDIHPHGSRSYTDGLIYHLVVHDAPTPPGIFAGLYMFHQSHLTGLFPFTFVNEYTTDSLGPLHGSQITFSIFCILRKFNPLELLIDCSDSRTETKAIRGGFFFEYGDYVYMRLLGV
jgi:hypothetical protein